MDTSIKNGIIGIPRPTRFYAPWEFVESLLNIKNLPIISKGGSNVDKNRDMLMKEALGFDFLLMIDTDMVFKKSDVDAIIKNMEDGLDIVSGLFKRNVDGLYSLYEKIGENDYLATYTAPIKLSEVDAVGGAFLAINRNVIEKMQDAPFEPIYIDGHWQSEDISFCHKAKQLGFKVWCNPFIKIGHIKSEVIY